VLLLCGPDVWPRGHIMSKLRPCCLSCDLACALNTNRLIAISTCNNENDSIVNTDAYTCRLDSFICVKKKKFLVGKLQSFRNSRTIQKLNTKPNTKRHAPDFELVDKVVSGTHPMPLDDTCQYPQRYESPQPCRNTDPNVAFFAQDYWTPDYRLLRVYGGQNPASGFSEFNDFTSFYYNTVFPYAVKTVPNSYYTMGSWCHREIVRRWCPA
jgi:hypothetical protein